MSVLDAFRLDGRVAVVTGGNRGLGVELDVTDPTSVAAMVERVTEELGPIDGLVTTRRR